MLKYSHILIDKLSPSPYYGILSSNNTRFLFSQWQHVTITRREGIYPRGIQTSIKTPLFVKQGKATTSIIFLLLTVLTV